MPDFPTGPYEVVPGEHDLTWSILDGDCEWIGDARGEDRENAADTAALLGASPLMYHACRAALAAMDSNSARDRLEAREQLRLAIGQAESGPSLLKVLEDREKNRLERVEQIRRRQEAL